MENLAPGTHTGRVHLDDEAAPAESEETNGSELNREGETESAILNSLAAEVRDQDEVERNINRQAEQLLNEQAIERELKRIEKSQVEKSKLESQISKAENRLYGSVPVGSAAATRLRSEIENYRAQVKFLDKDIDEIQSRIDERQTELVEQPKEQAANQRLPNESQRDFLIRTGKITPFSKLGGRVKKEEQNLQEALYNAEAGDEPVVSDAEPVAEPERSHRVLKRPGFEVDVPNESSPTSRESSQQPKRRKLVRRPRLDSEHSSDDIQSKGQASEDDGEFDPGMSNRQLALLGESEGQDEGAEYSEDEFVMDTPGVKRKSRSKQSNAHNDTEDLRGLDDGNEKLYQMRLKKWIKRRSAARRHASRQSQANLQPLDDPAEDEAASTAEDHEGGQDKEWNLPHPTVKDTEFDGGYKIPGDIYPALFDYQKTGVQWLWELYSQRVGGIVGDEMGLGKTIQVISFLAGLHYSKKLTRPVIVVCPATVMMQWVNEFHIWWPAFRVSILHTSGSGMIDIGRESKYEDELLDRQPSRSRKPLTKAEKAAKKIVERVATEGHILVTTYSGLQTYAELLIPVSWEYAVLDEGHKIRNPNAGITLYCKELRTPNRIILSGTPMQNNLVELWSLFDFIFPMRLGNLVDFKNQFEIPIRIGGYANASNLQIQTAGKCAETLKDAISPYLLQRMKVDVAADLPQKTERVLFCKLTKPQRAAYETFLDGDDMKSILNGRRQVLFGVDILRKICNHPDLADHKTLATKKGYDYGIGNKSGKMVVVKELLNLWKRGGHKTLLFAQHRIMLDILEKYVKTIDGMNYRRMDGTTAIAARQSMVDEFNTNPDAHVFLLTTKVGGLGVNLTGADRVIIFDPDWNPSTDIQARERAWRLGQKREVEIYRLMVAGTIEEKIFHRQIFKQFLTNKILKDPKQRQTFQMQDLHDLFSLGVQDGETETGKMFEGTETRFSQDVRAAPAVKPINRTLRNGEAKAAEAGGSEVVELAGVSSMRNYQPDDDNDKEVDEGDDPGSTDKPSASDKRIMEGLFARSGVQSALEHDQIINGKRVIAADPGMIEKEAQKVAREAAKELKKAETLARSLPAGTPTWTGQFGVAGRPGASSQRMGLSSAGRPNSLGVLAGLQARQAAEQDRASPSSSRSGTPASNRGRVDFLKQIRDFIGAHGGKVYTQMLIDHFNRLCTTPQKTAEFKAMLGQIAILQKGSRGRGAWVLKDEYKN